MSFFWNICWISEIADCCFMWVSFSLFNTSASKSSNFFTYLSFFNICFSSFWSISSFNLFYVSILFIKYCSCLIFEASFITCSSNLLSWAFLKYCLSILSSYLLFFWINPLLFEPLKAFNSVPVNILFSHFQTQVSILKLFL